MERMKRLLIYLFIILFIIGSAIAFIFSPKGSSLLQPYVKSQLEDALGVPVTIEKMNIGPRSGKIFLLLNKELHLRIAANYNMFDNSFKGIYRVDAAHFNYQKIKLKKIKLKGNFQGTPEHIALNGKGLALNSKAQYSLNIINNQAQKIEVKMKGVEVSEILQMTGNPALLKGKADVDIHMPSIGGKSVEGYGHITLHQAATNNKLIKKLYNVELPPKSYVLANVDAKLKGEKVLFTADSKSNMFGMKLQDAIFDMKKNEFTSRYAMHIKNLETLLLKESKLKSKDPVDVNGHITFKKTLMLTGDIIGLGKKTAFTYSKQRLKVNAKNLALMRFFSMLGIPHYVSGDMDIDVDVSTNEPRAGNFILSSKTITTNANEMQKILGNPLAMKLSLYSKGTLKKDLVLANSSIGSSMGILKLQNTVYNTSLLTLKSNYTLNIPDLRKTTPLTGKTFYGKFETSGILTQKDSMKISGISTSLGGKIDYTLIGNQLNSHISGVPLSGIFKLLGIHANFLGTASGTVKYDMKKKTGRLNFDVNSFRIKPSTFTRNATFFLGGKDPSRIIFQKTKFRATIKGNNILYALHAQGTRSSIDLRNGHINTKKNTHTATFKLVYEKRNIMGKIKGSFSNPKFSIVPSNATKKRIEKKVKSKLRKILGDKNSGFLKGLHF